MTHPAPSTFKKVAALACLAACAAAQAYDNVTVWNPAHHPVNIAVNYSGCRSDAFTVPAATLAAPGRATAGGSRGGCLLTSVHGQVVGRPNFGVAHYASSGTQRSVFLVRYMSGMNYKIYSDVELSGIFEREAFREDSPEGGFPTGQAANRIPLAPNLQACRDQNIVLDREINAMMDELIKAGKISTDKQRRWQALETGIRDRRNALAYDGNGFTLADCYEMTRLFEAERLEVISMAR